MKISDGLIKPFLFFVVTVILPFVLLVSLSSGCSKSPSGPTSDRFTVVEKVSITSWNINTTLVHVRDERTGEEFLVNLRGGILRLPKEKK